MGMIDELVGAILGVLTQLVIPRKGWGGTWITVLFGVVGSLLGQLVRGFFGAGGLIFSLVGALILLVPYALFKRATARGSAGEGNRGEPLAISPGTSSLTAQPMDVQSDESTPPPIGPRVSSAVGDIFLSYASSDRPTSASL
jgi:uncharacterized membrane protein YeaQ/YmgE (transglycosylase-associated protein family)